VKKKSKKTPDQSPNPGTRRIGLNYRADDELWTDDVKRGRKLRSPVSINMKSLSESFHQLREKSGLSVSQLAVAADLPPATIVKLEEKAVVIPMPTLITLLNEINCDLTIVPREDSSETDAAVQKKSARKKKTR